MMSCLKPITANKNTLEMVQYGVEGSTAFLECQARSPHVSIKWHLQKENSDRKKEVGRSPPWPLSQVMVSLICFMLNVPYLLFLKES